MARHKAGKQHGRSQTTAMTPADVASTLQQANHLLQQGQLQQAINICRQRLKQTPNEPELLSMLGILYAQQGKLDAAEKFLNRAVQQLPNEPTYHYNLGKIQSLQHKPDEALVSYRAALAISPNIAEAHLNIGNIHKLKAQFSEAINSYQQALHCNPGLAEAHYNLSVIYKERDQLTTANYHCREAIKLKPDFDLAYDLLGTLLSGVNQQQEAIQAHKQAIRCNPGLADAHYHLGTLYKDLNQLSTAGDYCQQAIKLKPDHAPAYNDLGTILSKQGDFPEAIRCQQRAIELEPETTWYYNCLGTTYMLCGDFIQARSCFRQAIDRNPSFGRAHYHLTLITRYKPDDPAIPTMQALLNQTELDPDDKLYLEFALGKACDDAGQFDAAFTYFKQGNQDKWAQTSYDHNGYVTFINSLMTTFDPGLFNRLNPCGTEDETPVFIIGMPRSGTSLIEQILAAHPDIHAGGEQAILESVFNEFFGADTFSSKISTATTEPFKKLGQRYIDGLRKLNPTARFITDKMPHNFHYVGLIALAMPNAKIIHCQRNPMDTCLSCFQKLFTTGHHYSYDLQDLGRHYLYYQKIMAYWHKLLPGKILDVRYEDVVNDMESQTRRLTDHCGLPWDESCLEFYRSSRPVNTASRDQANRPVYKDAVQRWKHYEQHLQPLIDIINKSPRP